MKTKDADSILKGVLDGISSLPKLAERAGVDPVELEARAETLERVIQLAGGFWKYAKENIAPAGLPPPRNVYFDSERSIEEQAAEYFAFEAVQRNNMTLERCVWTCGQLGLDADSAETAIENVATPWRAANGWRTYARLTEEGVFVLMNHAPVKLKRHFERALEALVAEA